VLQCSEWDFRSAARNSQVNIVRGVVLLDPPSSDEFLERKKQTDRMLSRMLSRSRVSGTMSTVGSSAGSDASGPSSAPQPWRTIQVLQIVLDEIFGPLPNTTTNAAVVDGKAPTTAFGDVAAHHQRGVSNITTISTASSALSSVLDSEDEEAHERHIEATKALLEARKALLNQLDPNDGRSAALECALRFAKAANAVADFPEKVSRGLPAVCTYYYDLLEFLHLQGAEYVCIRIYVCVFSLCATVELMTVCCCAVSPAVADNTGATVLYHLLSPMMTLSQSHTCSDAILQLARRYLVR